jgi:serine protease
MQQFLQNSFLALLLSAFLSLNLFAQQVETVPGDIIIQLVEGEEISDFIPDYYHTARAKTDLKFVETLSPQLNIHLINFNHNLVESASFLSTIRNDRRVFAAQFNHIGDFRGEIPNDELFDLQWQYINDGSNGGVEDADIDADLAWEITTGGYTYFGDTIVVCVVDNGTRLNHPDFQDNFWFNTREIPGNGIDDDGNGYVDDYNGWNVITNSDTMTETFDAHGTAVAGIIGADGNNEIGVTGVNWNVKVMNIRQGNTTEASVIAAYNYPYVMRKMYNESRGEKGAFVVAVNSSWGVNFGQPADAPIWCNFYNVMGEEGILNTGATANLNINVDEVGDLPTGCISDYLISVTNLQRNDVKRPAAGFGANSIHLGAYGHQTYTLSGSMGYGAFGGTSGATPHVAGVIALMYATDCGSLSYLAKADPQQAALNVRNALIESVVPNESLEGITITGGRLNAHTALLEILDECEPLDDCIAPYGVNSEEIIGENLTVSHLVSWGSLDSNASGFVLQYREVGEEDWNEVEIDVEQTTYLIEDIAFCSEIEVRVKCACETENTPDLESEFSLVYNIQTDGCCDAPELGSPQNITENEAEISWNFILAAESYAVRLRALDEEGEPLEWVQFDELEVLDFTFQNLEPCTFYEYELKINCVIDPDVEDWIEGESFKTKGCGACEDFEYCIARGNTTEDEWIESVEFNDFINVSGDNGGYADFTETLRIEAERDELIEFTLTPGHSGTLYPERFAIAIDYNQDGEFTGDELVFVSPAGVTSAESGEFTIPASAELGITRLRVLMRWNVAPLPCGTFTYGEVEDYCINISESTVGVNELYSNNNFFTVFPNPSRNNFTVLTKEAFTGTLNVYDVTGRLIHNAEIVGKEQIELNGSLFNQGVHLIQLIDRNGNLSHQKIIKQ